jgi:hypothetical protein
MVTMSKPKVKEFLKLPPPKSGTRCRVCCDAKVASDVADWAAARAAGGEHSLNGFYEGFLLKAYATPPSRGSVRNHVTKCLRLDVSSGKPAQ